MKYYAIIHSFNTQELCRLINESLEKGWVLYGPLLTNQIGVFFQPMTFTTKKRKSKIKSGLTGEGL